MRDSHTHCPSASWQVVTRNISGKSGMGSDDEQSIARRSYFSTDEGREAVSSLESTARFLAMVTDDPLMWRWAIIAVHSAAQGFMVCALAGSSNLGAYDEASRKRRLTAQNAHHEALATGDAQAIYVAEQAAFFGKVKLARFTELYDAIKEYDWPMRQFTNSGVYEPSDAQDKCIADLNDVRNEFIHFKPITRGFVLRQFPAITAAGLDVVGFLLRDSNNIMWAHEGDPLHDRAEAALADAHQQLAIINERYADLYAPAKPLCGWSLA
jgi:hypothetical protein